MHFIKDIVDLGVIKVHSINLIDFPYDDTGFDYFTSSEGCNCASVIFDIPNNKIVLDYQATSIPKHLVSVGKYSVSKTYTIKAKMKDGTEGTYNITFKAIVTN